MVPPAEVAGFNREIVEATSDLVCAFKPNLAFYEALGREGLMALERTLGAIPGHLPVIGDAKRSDIGSTAEAYARALFGVWGFDAVTVNPYLGGDSLEPFLRCKEKGVFILCRTSNPGAADFQGLSMKESGLPLYLEVARQAQGWNVWGNVGLVVGATAPEELRRVRGICPEMPILVPGVGAQGGDLEAAVVHGVDSRGRRAIISASRQVLYAYRNEGGGVGVAARRAALGLRDAINQVLDQRGWPW